MPFLRQKLAILFTGRATKRDQLVLFVVTLAIFLFGVIIAQFFYPGGYSILRNYVSDQGWQATNPETYWVFDTAVIVTGLLLIPLFLWLHKRLVPTTVLLSRIATFFSLVGCLGFSLVGGFRKDFEVPHDTVTVVAFGGLGLAAFFMLFVLLRKMMLREIWPNKVGYVIFFGQLMVVAVLSLVFALAKTTLARAGVDPAWLAWPPWEWLLLISMTIWMGGLLVMAPDLPDA